MPTPVKISDRLMVWAKQDARAADRSATAQIEHWATLGRAVEVIATYREVLALKNVGRSLPLPTFVRPEDVRELLMGLVLDSDRTEVKADIAASGAPFYEADPERPGMIVEIRADGTRIPGRLDGRRFVPDRE